MSKAQTKRLEAASNRLEQAIKDRVPVTEVFALLKVVFWIVWEEAGPEAAGRCAQRWIERL